MSDPDEVSTLNVPESGIPKVLTTPPQLEELAEALAEGHGPVAWDAERASGYRYSSRAFLIQGNRRGVGNFLIDPIPLRDLSCLTEACGDAEWVIHAANQDLECLRELGLEPPAELFDTELGSRIAGFERAGLGYLVETLLGVKLAKEHSAVDWSVRPLPDSWLAYATLDVDLLLELRDQIEENLAEQGKMSWARQEFDAVLHAPAPEAKVEPWRRTSGSHKIRGPQNLAALRALWEARDEIARDRDITPGRVLPDKAIINAVQAKPRTRAELMKLPVFSGPANRRLSKVWFDALQSGHRTPTAQCPAANKPSAGPPSHRSWKDRHPEAFSRLESARCALSELSELHWVPVENLLLPDSLRRLCWAPRGSSAEQISDQLTDLGARPWQTTLCANPIADAWTTAQTS